MEKTLYRIEYSQQFGDDGRTNTYTENFVGPEDDAMATIKRAHDILKKQLNPVTDKRCTSVSIKSCVPIGHIHHP